MGPSALGAGAYGPLCLGGRGPLSSAVRFVFKFE